MLCMKRSVSDSGRGLRDAYRFKLKSHNPLRKEIGEEEEKLRQKRHAVQFQIPTIDLKISINHCQAKKIAKSCDQHELNQNSNCAPTEHETGIENI